MVVKSVLSMQHQVCGCRAACLTVVGSFWELLIHSTLNICLQGCRTEIYILTVLGETMALANFSQRLYT